MGGQAHPGYVNHLLSDLPPFNLAGANEDLETAFAACVGEGVERLSQVERPGDISTSAPWAELADNLVPGLIALFAENHEQLGLSQFAHVDWTQARCLRTDKPVLVPADWCLRRAKGKMNLKPRTALSTGVAAGVTFEAAAVRALLELVERDAASLWWLAGQRGRPLAFETPAAREGVRLVQALRQDASYRTTWLLDLTTDLDIPAVAAVSFDADGRGFACGLAARLDLVDAVRAAIFEMGQMELALILAMAKQDQGGECALTEVDRNHLKRASMIDASNCALLHPHGVPSRQSAETGETGLAFLKSAFARCGVEAALVDLTRPEFTIPVVHAFAPVLQPMPPLSGTARLRSALASSGCSTSWNRGVSLF